MYFPIGNTSELQEFPYVNMCERRTATIWITAKINILTDVEKWDIIHVMTKESAHGIAVSFILYGDDSYRAGKAGLFYGIYIGALRERGSRNF